MANRFIREPREGGDNNVWAEYLLEHTRSIIGILTSRLYNSSGILKLKTGRIGIDNNTNKGIVVIDTEIAISIAGLSANNWIKIEMTVSGTVPTFTATDITGETDSGLLPSIIQNSYDGEKGGYYISNNKRCIGIAYLDAGGAIDYILNFKYNEQKKYERLFARVHNSGAQSEDYVYGRIQDMFSVVGAECIATGCIITAANTFLFLSRAVKTAANVITFYGVGYNIGGGIGVGTFAYTDGGAATNIASFVIEQQLKE